MVEAFGRGRSGLESGRWEVEMPWALRTFIMIVAVGSMNAESRAQPHQTQAAERKLTVSGKLVRVMAIGAESTGWCIELASPIKVENKVLNSIQVRYRSGSKLEKLADKKVKASGKIAVQHGVETGAQPVLEISSIQEVKTVADGTAAQPRPQQNIGNSSVEREPETYGPREPATPAECYFFGCAVGGRIPFRRKYMAAAL